ncbi:MAG: hypothetical protein GY944_30880 [bacterium]|nr:hypothetical protein [bacterium]
MALADAIRRGVRAAAWGWLIFAPAMLGCASTAVTGKGYRDAEHGYSLPHPASAQGVAWQPVSVDDAAVAYRGPDAAYMALTSRCEQPEQVDPAVLARQLLVGIENRVRVESEAFEFAGGRAFAQVFEAGEGDDVLRTRTVTLVRGDCVIDWVLAVRAGNLAVEESFELWWRGFEPDTAPETETGVAEAAP